MCIAAMGLPAEGIVSVWRNSLTEVADFLNTHHNGHYMISLPHHIYLHSCVMNISEEYYDESKLHLVKWLGWPDHHPPPLAHLIKLVKLMDEYLKQHEENVVVVHCKVILSFLLPF